MARLQGIDVSGYQQPDVIKQYNPDFVCIKATEGVGYTSDGLSTHMKAWAEYCEAHHIPMLTGLYHYARPDSGNTAAAEAEDFLSACKAEIYKYPQCVPLYILDWEGNALSYYQNWPHKFLSYVKAETNSTPLIYMSASVVRDQTWDQVRKIARLWVAAYTGGDPPAIKWWDNFTMWQYTDTPLDRDTFMSDEKAWRNLAGKPLAKGETWQIVEQSPKRIVLELK